MRFILPDKIISYIEKYSPVDRRVFLICLGLAGFFWFMKKMSNTYRTTWPVAISINHPPEIDLVTSIPSHITADLEGHGWDLMFLALGKKNLSIQFDQPVEGTLTLSKYLIIKGLEQELVNKKITIDKISTEGFSLTFDSLARKRVPVLFDYNILPAEQFRIKSKPEIEVDSVWILGPKVLLDTVFYIRTNKIKHVGLKESIEEKISFIQPVSTIHISPPTSRVSIFIEAETEKTIYVPLKVINPPVDSLSTDSLVVFPRRVNIAFVLGLSEYNAISEADFEVVVDLNGMKTESDRTTAPILLKKIPEGVENVTISPKSARFFYIKKDTILLDKETVKNG